MSDNVQANAPTTSGAIFKTDQDPGDNSHAPFTKLMFGALNTFTVVDSTHGLPVEIVTSSPIVVTGTFWQATQPISAAALPLPSGAASETTLGAINTKITACNTGAVVVASGTIAATQSGTWTVAATTIKPDGTNTMPSLDVAARAGFVKITDGTNTQPAMDAVGRAGFVKITDGTNTMPTMDSTARPGFVNLNLAGVAVSSGTGNAGTGTIRVAIATDQPALTNPQPVKDLAQTSGGLSMHCSGPLANSNNATTVKASAGQVYAIQVFNVTATVAYLKLYNKASNPAPASDTPVKVIPIPANTSVGGVSVKWEKGLEFTTGIAYAVVTGISSTDNTSVAANSGIVNIDYK